MSKQGLRKGSGGDVVKYGRGTGGNGIDVVRRAWEESEELKMVGWYGEGEEDEEGEVEKEKNVK